jgi:hypothetical protein
VKQKRQEEIRKLQWREDLKSRQSKVKELDQVKKSIEFVNFVESEERVECQAKISIYILF